MAIRSADIPRMVSSLITRSSSISLDELRRIEKDEEDLNKLNHRFANYLKKILHLGEKNLHLRRQVEEKYLNITNENLFENEWNHIRREGNIEFGKLISVQIRFQRAIYEKNYYKTQLPSSSIIDQLQQQLDANISELNLLKQQYDKQIENLQSYKNQYHEYTIKLLEYTDQYNRIIFERMQNEYRLCTLREEFLFEREYNSRCREEWECFEQIQYDLNDQLTKKEFANIVEQIREDYRTYNEIQFMELEMLYKNKFESSVRQEKKEDVKPLIEENRNLRQKLKQLEEEFRRLIERNHEEYEALNDEYHQLEFRLPKFESSIENSRANTVHLTSEIRTYQCLLTNLVRKSKAPEFTVHFGNGIIWCRI